MVNLLKQNSSMSLFIFATTGDQVSRQWKKSSDQFAKLEIWNKISENKILNKNMIDKY